MPEDTAIKDLYRSAIPSVVSVYVTHVGTAMSERNGGAGSGFVYDDRHVVTNQHVVGDATYVELRFADGAWRSGRVIGADPYTDLAVIAVDDLPPDAVPLPVATTNPEPGERVAAIGNPMGLDGTITVGFVSGTNRSSPTGHGFTIPETIQTDAAVNPGNSGGPLLTLDGTVVGVNRAKTGDNIGFAISPIIVNRVVPSLIESGTFRLAYLNVRTLDVAPTVAEANGLTEPTGVLVVDAGTGSTLRGCDRIAGVRRIAVPVGGDVIVEINGEPVHSTEELTSYLITSVAPNDVVELTVLREGRTLTIPVAATERPPPLEPAVRRGRAPNSPRWRRNGALEPRGDDGQRGQRIPIG